MRAAISNKAQGDQLELIGIALAISRRGRDPKGELVAHAGCVSGSAMSIARTSRHASSSARVIKERVSQSKESSGNDMLPCILVAGDWKFHVGIQTDDVRLNSRQGRQRGRCSGVVPASARSGSLRRALLAMPMKTNAANWPSKRWRWTIKVSRDRAKRQRGFPNVQGSLD